MDTESLSGEASLKSPSPTKCQVKRELLIMHVATCGAFMFQRMLRQLFILYSMILIAHHCISY